MKFNIRRLKMFLSPQIRKKGCRFTLLELLIVIAIIAILAGMLLPALNSVREKGLKILCIGNMRQLGLATMNYQSDNNDFFQRETLGGTGTYADAWTYHFVIKAKYSTHETMLCPVAKNYIPSDKKREWDKKSSSTTVDFWSKGTYAINYREFGCFSGDLAAVKTKIGEIRRPSYFLVATEAALGNGTFPTDPVPYYSVDNFDNWGYRSVYPRHNKLEANVLWGDGHCSSVRGHGGTSEQISRSYTKYSNSPLKDYSFDGNPWTFNGLGRESKARP